MTRLVPRVLAFVATGALWATPLLAQFGQSQNKITYETFDWQVYHSPHFDIHYYPSMEPFLEELVSYAESAYLELSRDLDYELRFRVPLIAYKTHGEFEQTNVTLARLPEGVGAFAEPVQHRMVLPIDLPPDKLYQLISHELVHIFQYAMFYEGYLGRALRSDPPAWLMEGMASYFGHDEDNIDRMVIRDAVINGVLPPIEALHFVTFLTYRYGHAIFDFIEQEHGLEGVRTFLFEYRKVLLQNNLEKAVKEAFGYDLDEFNRRFGRYLRQKYFPVLLEKKAPDDYGKQIGVKKDDVYTTSPAISPSGELIAVLATPGMEWDLVVLSGDDGKVVENLTAGWTNEYQYLTVAAFEGKRDLSWSPVSDHIAAFVRRENKWPLLVFDALNGKIREELVFDDIVECASPAFSPDGQRIAFEGNRNGVVDIFEVDLTTREVRNLTQDDFFDANPWYAADGRSLLYDRRIGPFWKIFSVDTADPAKKTQLTFGESSDVQPSFSRDGKKVYFSSDRGVYGVYNIHALDLATGELAQYTDVVGGCFAPVELAEREGESFLAFSAFFGGRFQLYRMPLGEPEHEVEAERAAQPIEAQPFQPPLQLTVDAASKAPYKLKWDIEAPAVEVGVADDGTFLGAAALQFSDLLGDHRVQILATSVSDFSNFNVVYLNLKRRFNWGGAAYDFRDYFLLSNSAGFVQRDQIYRNTGANAFIEYPFNRYYRTDASVGFLDTSRDQIVDVDLFGIPDFETLSDRYATVSLGLTGDTVRWQEFGPFQGKRLRLSTLYASHLSGDRPGSIAEQRLDFRAYRQATRRSLVAWRLASVYNTGEREGYYGFGGLNQLRGHDFRDFIGSRLAWSNLEFRFPLIDELRFPVFPIGPIRGFFFLDVGSAWLYDDLWYDPEQIFVVTDPDDPGQTLGFVRGGVRADPNTGEILPFQFWDSDNGRLQDGRASWGAGFQFRFIAGLQFNWIWAKRMPHTAYCSSGIDPCVLAPLGAVVDGQSAGEVEQRKIDSGDTRTEFYIAFDW